MRLSPVRADRPACPGRDQHPRRGRVDRLPGGYDCACGTDWGNPPVWRGGCGRDRRGDHARPCVRGTVATPVRRNRGIQGGVRRRPLQGDSRYRRPGNVAQRGASEPGGHDGGRRFHQDLHRQGKRECHAAGRAGDDTRDSRVFRAHWDGRWVQAGRRDPHRKAVARVAGTHERGVGPELAGTAPVQDRREQHAGRYRATIGVPRQRALFRLLPSPAGLTSNLWRTPPWLKTFAPWTMVRPPKTRPRHSHGWISSKAASGTSSAVPGPPPWKARTSKPATPPPAKKTSASPQGGDPEWT